MKIQNDTKVSYKRSEQAWESHSCHEGRGGGAQAAAREGTSSGRPRPHGGRAPGPGQGACSGPLHPPPPRPNKRGREGLKAALCLPKPDSPAGSPLGARNQQKASSAQGTGAAARRGGREARGGAVPDTPVGGGQRLTPVAGRSGHQDPGLGTPARRPSAPGAPPRAHCLSTLSHASSLLLTRSYKQDFIRDTPPPKRKTPPEHTA